MKLYDSIFLDENFEGVSKEDDYEIEIFKDRDGFSVIVKNRSITGLANLSFGELIHKLKEMGATDKIKSDIIAEFI